MREIRQSGSEGGAGQTNVPFLPLSSLRLGQAAWGGIIHAAWAGESWFFYRLTLGRSCFLRSVTGVEELRGAA